VSLRRATTTLCLLAAAALALAGCGGSRHARRHLGALRAVAIYSSLPLQGPQAAQGIAVQNGIRLALAQSDGRAGPFAIHYRSLDDARAGGGAWSVSQVQKNAMAAAADTAAVAYIGQLSSAASEVSMPVLNEARLAQVSPTATAVGLTTHDPGAGPEEPVRYQPSGRPTFLRLAPNDAVEAAADLEAMRGAGCSRAAVAYEDDAYGSGQALTMQQLADAYRLRVTLAPAVGAPDARAFAATLRADHVNCFEYAGSALSDAVALTDAVHAQLPAAKLFVPHPLCSPSFTEQALGGVSAQAALELQCTTIFAPAGQYPGAATFAGAYRARYHAAPTTPALFGYTAMQLALSAIASLGARGDQREAVLSALFAAHVRHSPLGDFTFDAAGDSTLRTIALYRCASGRPSFYSLLSPGVVLGAERS